MRLVRTITWLLAVAATLTTALPEAHAQEDEPTQDSGSEEEKVEQAPAKAKLPADREEEVQFRGGISGGGGIMYFTTASELGGSLLLGIGGFDGRLGVQFNDLIGLYVQPQTGLYGADGAVGGLAGGAVVVDFTFFDQLFVGAGAGAVVLNNPAAAEVIVRFGGYPAFGFGEDGNRRKGLMLGIDFRLFIAPVGSSTLVAPSPTLNLGYEAY